MSYGMGPGKDSPKTSCSCRNCGPTPVYSIVDLRDYDTETTEDLTSDDSSEESTIPPMLTRDDDESSCSSTDLDLDLEDRPTAKMNLTTAKVPPIDDVIPTEIDLPPQVSALSERTRPPRSRCRHRGVLQ